MQKQVAILVTILLLVGLGLEHKRIYNLFPHPIPPVPPVTVVVAFEAYGLVNVTPVSVMATDPTGKQIKLPAKQGVAIFKMDRNTLYQLSLQTLFKQEVRTCLIPLNAQPNSQGWFDASQFSAQ